MDFEQKLLLKQMEQRFLDKYGFDTMEEVLEYLKYEKKQLLQKRKIQKGVL